MGIIEKIKKQFKSDEKTTPSVVSDETFNNYNLMEVSEALLADTTNRINSSNTISMPISELASLGGVVAAIVPQLNSITSPVKEGSETLYQLVNAGVGDTLKIAKNGNSWGAIKTAEGTSKMAQFKAVNPAEITTGVGPVIDPVTMIMAVALFSIEQELGKIERIGKQILSFIQEDKESQIEGDIDVLMNTMREYKHNWNNEKYNQNHAMLALDIKRKAIHNIRFYKKRVTDIQSKSHVIVGNSTIDSVNAQLQDSLRYYRLSLYTYSLASFMEVMLLGNYQEKNFTEVKNTIDNYSLEYREVFTSCSTYLEAVAKDSIEKVTVKGLGVVENTLGNIIGSIPLVKEGQVDEWLLKNASHLKETAEGMDKDVLEQLASVANPGTSIFVDKLDEMIRIYNSTEQIYCDEKKIYLVAG